MKTATQDSRAFVPARARRRVALSLLLVSMGSGAAVATAWGMQQGSHAMATKSAPHEDDAVDPARLLVDVRAAFAKLEAFSYTAKFTRASEDAPTLRSTASVSARKIDDQSWKVWAKGQLEGEGAEASNAMGFEVANDGATSRSLDAVQRVVLERADADWNGVFAFFENFAKDAAPSVLWELGKGSKAFAAPLFPDTPESAGHLEVGGVMCDGMAFRHSKASGATSVRVQRVYVGREHKLPLRFEDVRENDQGSAISGQVLELQALKVNGEAQAGRYTIEVPDGYRIRPARLTRSAMQGEKDAKPQDQGGAGPRAGPAAGQAEGLPAIEGVTWKQSSRLIPRGQAAPDFSLKDAEGATYTLASFKGKVVVLDFWATWCGPCKASMPALQRIHEKFGDKGVVVVGMSTEGPQSRADVTKFKKDNGLTYLSLLKAEPVAARYRASGLPTFYVLDEEGKVVWGAVGLERPPGKHSATMAEVMDHIESQLTKIVEYALKD